MGYLSVTDDLQTVGMEDSTECLVELVKLVDLSWHPLVPQDTVAQDEVVRGVEGSFVPGVSVAVGGSESPDSLTSVQVPDGGHSLGTGPHHFVLQDLGELQTLLLPERHLLLEELADGPDLAVGKPPVGAGDDELAVVAGLDVVDVTLLLSLYQDISYHSRSHFLRLVL